ncbi:hypothetical protein EV561_15410 [Rhizobium sp. BK376]|nr:hypothetical protein EV561_15410 [Rhizobium sp. BK376]
MSDPEDPNPTPATVSALPHLAEALDDDRFRQFLDHVPFAVAVAELDSEEHLVYGNIEFVVSDPGKGMAVTIIFKRQDALAGIVKLTELGA